MNTKVLLTHRETLTHGKERCKGLYLKVITNEKIEICVNVLHDIIRMNVLTNQHTSNQPINELST